MTYDHLGHQNILARCLKPYCDVSQAIVVGFEYIDQSEAIFHLRRMFTSTHDTQ